MKEQDSSTSKNVTYETTAVSFRDVFDKKNYNAAIEGFRRKMGTEKGINQISEMQTCDKEEAALRAKKSKDTIFIFENSMIKRVDGYLLTKSISHKLLVNVRSFAAAKTIDMYDHLKPTSVK